MAIKTTMLVTIFNNNTFNNKNIDNAILSIKGVYFPFPYL